MNASLHVFSANKYPTPDRDLLTMRQLTGGKIGDVTVGNESAQVLEVSTGIYVTSKPLPPQVALAVSMDRMDAHVIRSTAEFQTFLERWRAFDRG